jgi:hypothetical protein
LERVLNNKAAFLSVFKEVGLLFLSQRPEVIDEDELWELSRVYLKEIYLTTSHKTPEINATHMVNQDNPTQTILLDLSLFQVRPDPEEAVYSRMPFMLLVKLLHGSAHCLTPVFNRWARKAHNDPMPITAGTMYAGQADKPGVCISFSCFLCIPLIDLCRSDDFRRLWSGSGSLAVRRPSAASCTA